MPQKPSGGKFLAVAFAAAALCVLAAGFAALQSDGSDAKLYDEFTVGPLKYIITGENPNEVTIIGGGSAAGPLTVPGTVVNPDDSEIYNVTKIRENTFKDNKNITGLAFGTESNPSRLTHVGNGAFHGCSSLVGQLTLPAGLVSIGDDAFRATEFTGQLTLPEGLFYLGDHAFKNCKFDGLRFGGERPELTSIGKEAFYGCPNLAGKLELPSGLVSIGERSFAFCPYLTGLAFGADGTPSRLATIDDWAFEGCVSLSGKLALPDGLAHIGRGAFSFCGFDGPLFVPASVTFVGEYAFQVCDDFEYIVFFGESAPNLGDYSFCLNTMGSVVEYKVASNIEGRFLDGYSNEWTSFDYGYAYLRAGPETPGTGTVTGEGLYRLNEEAEVVCTPAAGYEFRGFAGDAKPVDGKMKMTGNIELVAVFAEIGAGPGPDEASGQVVSLAAAAAIAAVAAAAGAGLSYLILARRR